MASTSSEQRRRWCSHEHCQIPLQRFPPCSCSEVAKIDKRHSRRTAAKATPTEIKILVYLALISKSPYRVPCLALLNALIFFCAFDNMIAITTMSLPLLWPLLLPLH
jgi:hypothetical protein